MKVFYKCRCMDQEAAVTVRARPADMDVVDWVKNDVTMAITIHHGLSRACPETTMEYVKIPVLDDTPYIGAEPKLNS